VGIGFSYNRGKPVTNTYDAANHFTNFMYNFLNNWNMLKNPLYIAGESYAGHYIPAFARHIMLNVSLGFNLKGVMIGDGYLDPVNQLNFYDSFMYSAGIASSFARDTTTYAQNQALLKLFS
jgi:carboxypeptidase C (cathepsin A)